MIQFACPRCDTTQRTTDDVAGQKLPCVRCGQRLRIPDSPEMRSRHVVLAPPKVAAVKGGNQWFYEQGGKQFGPVAWVKLKRIAAEGDLSVEDRVWSEATVGWKPARTVPNLFPKQGETLPVDSSGDRRGKGQKGFAIVFFGSLCGLALLAVVGFFVWKAVGKDRAETSVTHEVAVATQAEKAKLPEARGTEKPKTVDYQVYEKALKSCVWILTTTDDKTIRDGSGSVIDHEQRLVLTNQHVVNEKCVEILVLFPAFREDKQLIVEKDFYMREREGGNAVVAELIKADRTHDLAVIQLKKMPEYAIPLRLAKESVKPSQEICCIGGSPKGNDQGMWIPSFGKVRQVYHLEWNYGDGDGMREADIIASQLGTNPGDSGGPIVDAECRLVGVNAMSSVGANQNVGHIDISEVRRFLPLCYRKLGKVWKEAD